MSILPVLIAPESSSTSQHIRNLTPLDEEPPKAREVKSPPEFTPRYNITNLFSQFAKEFADNARDRGVELHWIGLGTWKTPVEIVPEKHLEAWRLSRENLSRGSDEAMKDFETDTIQQKIKALILDVPIIVHQDAASKAQDHKHAMRALLIAYRQQLHEAELFMEEKGEAVPLVIREAINHIDKVLGIHWVGKQ